MKSVRKIVGLGVVCFLSCCSTLFALSLEVNTLADVSSPPPPQESLRSAIAKANSSTTPTTITFDSTLFATPQIIRLIGMQLELSNTSQPITITGPAAGVTISGENQSRVFEIDSNVTAALSNVTITAGSGGGIHAQNSHLTLTNVAVSGNTSSISYCPGISSNNGTLTLRDVTVSGNIHSGYGSGGGIYNSGTATLTNVTVFGNAVSSTWDTCGGGICNEGTATLTNVTVCGNTILGEYNSWGGGIYNNETMTLTNVTISGNTASSVSAYWIDDGGIGGGIFNYAMPAAFTIANTIVANNNASKGAAASANGPDVYGGFNSRGYNLIGKKDGSAGFDSILDLFGTIAFPLEPKLAPLADNAGPTPTMALLGGSPAIDHGYNYYIPVEAYNKDQRGLDRIANSTVDIGAYEYQLIVSKTSLTLPATIQGTAGDTTSFTVRGIGLGNVDTLTLSAPPGSEISKDGLSFYSTVELYSNASGDLPTTTVYARISALATVNVSGNLYFQDADYHSLDKSIPVSGTVYPVVSVTVQTSPSGRSFTVGGTTYTSAQLFRWVSGSGHTIATTSPQSGGADIQYVWSSWSDGLGMSHSVAPTVDTTYTANFGTQYYLRMSLGTGSGSISPGSGWYDSVASVGISATPAAGYRFSSWSGVGSGSYSGSSSSASVTMNEPITETANFKEVVATPTFSPPGGDYNTTQFVSLNCATGGAAIHYTTNGTTPTAGSPTYSDPISVETSTTIKAIGTKDNCFDSELATASFRIDKVGPIVRDVANIPTEVRKALDASITLTATADDSPTGGSNIAAAEYFVGTDPKEGHGIAMNAADGMYSAPTEALTATVNTSTWTEGTRRIYVRAKDSAGNWTTPVAFVDVDVVDATVPGRISDLVAHPAASLVVITTADLEDYSSQHVTYDVGALVKVGAVSLASVGLLSLFPKDPAIAVSQDNSSWTAVAEAHAFKAAAGSYLWQFEQVDARYVRISGSGIKDSAAVLIYKSRGKAAAELIWRAPGDDGYDLGSGPVSEYDVRCNGQPVDGDWTHNLKGPLETEDRVVGVDVTGPANFTVKSADEVPNWSMISNSAPATLYSSGFLPDTPANGTNADAGSLPTFRFGIEPGMTTAAICFSSCAGFPPVATERDDGQIDKCLRFALKTTATFWRPTASQWKAIKALACTEDTIWWRLEGKQPTYGKVFGPVRYVLFDCGEIANLDAEPSHDKGGDEAIWPDKATPPNFRWTYDGSGVSPAALMTYFWVDISTDGDIPLGDSTKTLTVGGSGIKPWSYTLTTAQWKRVRQLATKGNGTLHWRVRGKDASKVLECASAPKTLVVDGGTLVLLPSDPFGSGVISWSHDTGGVNYTYRLQFSRNGSFLTTGSQTITVPAKGIHGFSCPLTLKQKQALSNFADKKGVTSLYYRVRAETEDKTFVTYSDALTTPVP